MRKSDTIFDNIHFVPYVKADLPLIHADRRASILKFIGGRRSRSCCGFPFEFVASRINSSVPIRLAQCLLINPPRRTA